MKKSILLPTDFTELAYHAADYAINLAKQINISEIIIYHAWQAPVTIDAGYSNANLMNGEELREISDENLNSFAEKIQKIAGDSIQIIKEIEYSPVASGVEDICEKHDVAYVVMSVSGSGKFVEKVIGSNAVTTAKNSTIPVIIVPANYHFQPIKNIALSCDYKEIKSTIPITPIKTILNETTAKLFVVNVDVTRELSDQDLEDANKMLHESFESTDPEFHILEEDNFVDAINNFSKENDIDLIIAVPKKKGFFETLFKGSRTTELAFNSKTPILVVH
ncbi:universal stress protein [Rhizosphaericola mali]|uniref:Universal stress protein n=1 Tax=Rhizosphaericola mali TaxID=2545455 RepID=A0A5P2G4F3_9BACT|nr:universal stress protein [Rhizosphaericola mali]QES89568.1 universal stress protein [Rhizosphaericola mali]